MYEPNMARVHCYIAVFLILGKFSECAKKQTNMEGYIVGGEYTTIDKFPHAVYLSMHCGDDFWMCGASIVNQRILITAGHCLYRCGTSHNIKCFVGHENVKQASHYRVKIFKVHEHYSEEELCFDLAMATTETPIALGHKVKRIVIPNHFPENVKAARVAGWGLTVDRGNARVSTKRLKTVGQIMRDLDTCENILGDMEEGTFCAGDIINDDNRPSMGDSGSGLIYKTRIQIGLVSYRVDEHPALMVYTNVTHFYPWIEETARTLYCQAVSLENY